MGRAVLLPIIAVVIGVGPGIVPAGAKSSPVFPSATAAASDQHDVGATFTETGLAPGAVVTERLRGKATDTYACYAPDGSRAGSEALIEHPSNQAQYEADSQGTIDAASIAIQVQPLDTCPSGQISYLFETVFSNLRLTDLTNQVAINIPGTFTSCSPADCQPPVHL
jgi:hypothetical protein